MRLLDPILRSVVVEPAGPDVAGGRSGLLSARARSELQSTDGAGTWNKGDSWLAAALVAGAFAIGATATRGTSLWGDEAFSWGLVHLPTREFVGYLWGPQTNMTAYYVLLRAWLGLLTAAHVAPTELAARVPSIAAESLSVCVVYRFARQYWRRVVALSGACLYGLNYVVLAPTTELRSYGLEMLLVCLSWQLLLPMLTGRRPASVRRWSAYCVVTALSVYAHVFSVFVLAAQAVVVWLAYRAERSAGSGVARDLRRHAGGAWLALTVLVAPIALVVVLYGRATYVPPAGIHALAGTLWNFGGRSVAYTLCLLVSGALVVRASINRLRQDRAACPAGPWWQPSLPTTALWSWLTVPTVLAFAFTQPWLNLHVYDTFYLVAVAPALSILVALGVGALRLRALSTVALCGLLVASLFGLHTFLENRQRQNFSAAARWIETRWRSGDGLVCGSWSCSLALDYYFRDQPVLDSTLRSAPGHWSWPEGAETAVDLRTALGPYAESRPGVFFVTSPLKGDPRSAVAQSASIHTWLAGHCRTDGQLSTSNSSLGTVVSQLYEGCSTTPTGAQAGPPAAGPRR